MAERIKKTNAKATKTSKTTKAAKTTRAKSTTTRRTSSTGRKTATRGTRSKTAAALAITEQQVRERAFQIFMARNGHPGDPVADWYQAERELNAELKA